MKRFLIGALTLIMTASVAMGQVSLLNEATNGLFHNVNDFIIKPNKMFNTVDSQQLLIGGGFNSTGLAGNSNSGALLGYYHPSSIRWSTLGYLHLESQDHNVETIQSTTTTQYENPAFSTYKGGARFTMGLPDALNLSAGLLFLFEGNTAQPISTTVTESGQEPVVTTSTAQNKLDLTIGIPLGLEFTPAIYNYFNPILRIERITDIAGSTSNNAPVDPSGNVGNAELKNDVTTNISFTVYDKLTIQDLLPNPFGSETAFWIGIGNVKLTLIEELEQPAYMIDSGTEGNYTELKFATQFGMSNLINHSIDDIEVRMKPMVYFDILTGDYKSFTFGATVAAAAGIYAPLGKLPMVLFCGVTPSLQFYTTTYKTQKTEGNTVITEKAASRALTTNVLWSGKVGTSIILPRDMVLDVTFNVNNNTELSLGLSAQMTIAL